MNENIGRLGWLGRMSMGNGRFQEAIIQFTEGLRRVPRNLPALAAPFLVDRSECHWHLYHFQDSLEDMRMATSIGLPPCDVDEAEVSTASSTIFNVLRLNWRNSTLF